MTASKIFYYLSMIFFIIAIIGLSLIVFGIYVITTYNQPVNIALNATISGIILLPIGLVFAVILLHHGLSYKKKQETEI